MDDLATRTCTVGKLQRLVPSLLYLPRFSRSQSDSCYSRLIYISLLRVCLPWLLLLPRALFVYRRFTLVLLGLRAVIASSTKTLILPEFTKRIALLNHANAPQHWSHDPINLTSSIYPLQLLSTWPSRPQKRVGYGSSKPTSPLIPYSHGYHFRSPLQSPSLPRKIKIFWQH